MCSNTIHEILEALILKPKPPPLFYLRPFFTLQLAGAACAALGVYILVSDYGPKELSGVLGNELYHIAAYVAIAGGAAIAVISLCGCVGAAKESKIVLALVSGLRTYQVKNTIQHPNHTLFVVFIPHATSCGGYNVFDTSVSQSVSQSWFFLLAQLL